MEKGDDPYQILGLSRSDVALDPSCIKKNFRQLARIHHPDKNRGEDSRIAARTFAKINHAYEVLRDDESRRSYDLSQLHSKQGYDPNGPRYYDQNQNKSNHAKFDGKNHTASNTNFFSDSTRRSTCSPVKPQTQFQTLDRSNTSGYRIASVTQVDKVSGVTKRINFKTASDGTKTIDIKSSDRTGSSYFVPRLTEEKRQQLYKLFQDNFGTEKANEYFNGKEIECHSANRGPRQKHKSTKSKPVLIRKKDTERSRTEKLFAPSSPRTVSVAFDGNAAHTFQTEEEKKKNRVHLSGANKRVMSTTKKYSCIGPGNIDFLEKYEGNIQSISTKERVVVNPNSKHKEVLVEITVTMFDGSSETHKERRRVR